MAAAAAGAPVRRVAMPMAPAAVNTTGRASNAVAGVARRSKSEGLLQIAYVAPKVTRAEPKASPAPPRSLTLVF